MLSWFVTRCFSTGFASYLVRKCFTISHFQIWINAKLFALPTPQLSLEETGGCQRRPISIHMAKLMFSKKTVEAMVFPFSTYVCFHGDLKARSKAWALCHVPYSRSVIVIVLTGFDFMINYNEDVFCKMELNLLCYIKKNAL